MKRKLIAWLADEKRLQRYPFLRRFFWKRGEVFRRMEQQAACMRKKEVITVAFMVLNLPCWKCDSVFRLMMQHPRFRPVIWIVPELQIKDADEQLCNLLKMREFFDQRNYLVAELYTLEQMREEYAPDVVFLAKPYMGVTHWDAWNMDQELVCYVPYCFQNGKREDFLFCQENHLWRNFYATKGVSNICEQVMANAAANVVITGSPSVDSFLHESCEKKASVWKNCGADMKKVIWAPHWSISGESWFKVATFLEVAEGMLHLAEKYAERVQWAFKPHPLLRDTLYQLPDWGRERTDAYYERWASLPNTQLETGAYVGLFKQSDAMVHDSGSFIMEYLLVDKPCMYLVASEGFSDFNADTHQALACYQKGKSAADVELFLQSLLQCKPDSMSRARARYRKRCLIPPGGQSAAQNILQAILKSR